MSNTQPQTWPTFSRVERVQAVLSKDPVLSKLLSDVTIELPKKSGGNAKVLRDAAEVTKKIVEDGHCPFNIKVPAILEYGSKILKSSNSPVNELVVGTSNAPAEIVSKPETAPTKKKGEKDTYTYEEALSLVASMKANKNLSVTTLLICAHSIAQEHDKSPGARDRVAALDRIRASYSQVSFS